jgi:hypothetical protein
MSDQVKGKDAELLQELSEPEQEAVAGGFGLEDLFSSFFFQKTDIDTSAEDNTHIAPVGISNSRRTRYRLSQVTIAFTTPYSSFARRRSRRPGRSRLNNIFNLFQDSWGD